MAWFQKKKSPVDRRLDQLNDQIAELESQLRKQQEEAQRRAAEAANPPQPDGQGRGQTADASQPVTQAPKIPDKPRFRTTVNPRGVSPVHGIEPHEVDFFARRDRPVDFSLESEAPAKSKSADANKTVPPTAQPKVLQVINDFLNLFNKPKPQPQQERLASYLTTGSFQRLKPLRYERRVARTRLIILGVIITVIVILLIKFVMR